MCWQYTRNLHDFYVVAVMHGHDTVGHVPHAISTPCNLIF